MNFHHRGLLAAASVTAALAVPTLLASPVHAEEQPSTGPDVTSREQAEALNEYSVAKIVTTVSGYVWDEDAGDGGGYIDDGKGNAIEIVTTIECTGYVVASEGVVATSSTCLDQGLARELLKLEAYDVASGNGFNDRWYAAGWESYPIEDFTEFYRVNSVDQYDNLQRNRATLSTKVTVINPTTGQPTTANAEVLGRQRPSEGNGGLLRIDRSGLIPVSIADQPVASADPVAVLGFQQSGTSYASTSVGPAMTHGVYSEHQLTTRSDYRFDGAPVVNDAGEVVGTLYAGGDDPDVLNPVARIENLLAAAGVANTADANAQAFRDGIHAYLAGERATALDLLQQVVDAQPGNAVAKEYLAKAEALPEPPAPQQGEQGAGDSWLMWVLLGAIALGVLLAVLTLVLLLTSRRRAARARYRVQQYPPVPPVPYAPQPVPYAAPHDATQMPVGFQTPYGYAPPPPPAPGWHGHSGGNGSPHWG